jgi:hypothetical protein
MVINNNNIIIIITTTTTTTTIWNLKPEWWGASLAKETYHGKGNLYMIRDDDGR